MEEVVVINGVRYVKERDKSNDIRIVVLHRGNIVVGRYSLVGDEVLVTGASVIRIWGTTAGLGEIALGGPTSKTILDYCGTVRCHKLAVIFTLDCTVEKWESRIK